MSNSPIVSGQWSRRKLLESIPALVALSAVPFCASETAPVEGSKAPGTQRRRTVIPRKRHLLNARWRFFLGEEKGAEAAGFDDHSWQRVALPHSFGTPYFARAGFYVGYGWYRKTINLPPLSPGRRTAMEFDGAFQDAELFVNGQRVGQHLGGYTGFSFDVTGFLKPGENVFAVRVNNLWNAQLNPRAGEHQFNGGIYRNVYLVETSDLHVTWYGTFVTTPGLQDGDGSVHVGTEIRNASDRARRFQLITHIVDTNGRVVAEAWTQESISAQSTSNFKQVTSPVSNPALWSPSHPNMYSAHTLLVENSHLVDDYVTPFGFRWFKWTSEQGFFLNGAHHYFHGADVHQDHAGWCDAVPDSGVVRDVTMVKQAGMDFIRGSHYPHSPIFSEACDHLGVLLWSENCFWGTGGEKQEGYWTASAYPPNEADQKPFENSVKRSLREMVRIHRNHPSIVIWSMGNEVFFSDENLMPKVRTFVKELVEEAHRLDPSRPAGLGGVQRGSLDHLSDVAGYNGDGAKLFLDPGIPNAVTEYDTEASVRPGKYWAGWGDLAGQPEFAWRSGQVLWCAFDHGSILGPSLGNTGMIDYFRLPKQQWYWYRSAYAHIPPPDPAQEGAPAALYLYTDLKGTLRADGTGDAHIVVAVLNASAKRIANVLPVTLEIVEGPGEFPTGRSITFSPDSDIPIRDGLAAIELHAYESGTISIRASSSGLAPAHLSLCAEGGPLFLAGVTPVTASRPYIVYPSPLTRKAKAFNIALNHPTSSSSSLANHVSRFVNDGDLRTYWQPSPAQQGEVWWQIDFESRCVVNAVHLSFTIPSAYQFAIECQAQDGSWITVVDKRTNRECATEFTEHLPNTVESRLLRIVFTSPSKALFVQLQEAQVFGSPVE